MLGCALLQAEQHDTHGNKAEKFVQKALMSGQMEVQMGQLAQQKGQSQEVKDFGATLVRDHTQANQKLQKIASTKNITVKPAASGSSATTSSDQAKSSDRDLAASTHGDKEHAKQAKHQQHLNKLRTQSGAEFDKAFVSMALKHHKKDIAEFEKCRTDLNDPELTAFIDETLPKLRQHLQMAQAAARTVGVDEASIAADVDIDDDSDTAVGAPATGATGTRGSDKPSSPASNPNKDRSSFDNNSRYNGAVSSDTSGTIHQNNPRADLDANIGDRSVSADVDVDRNDRSISADVDTDTGRRGKLFQKGDGKVLGLSTDKNDGKFLGIIPNPNKNDNDDDHDASFNADVDVNGNDASIGGSASTERGTSRSDQK